MGAGFDVGAQGDGGDPGVGMGDIELGAGAKGDHAEALAAEELVAGADGGDDAAGDGADDLADDGHGFLRGGVGQGDRVPFPIPRFFIISV